MDSELNDIERSTLATFLATPGPVRSALQKFAAAKKAQCERMSADSLRVLPRQIEQACDHASKAEAYGTLMDDLGRFAAK